MDSATRIKASIAACHSGASCLGFRKLGDVGPGILQADELPTTGQPDWIVEARQPRLEDLRLLQGWEINPIQVRGLLALRIRAPIAVLTLIGTVTLVFRLHPLTGDLAATTASAFPHAQERATRIVDIFAIKNLEQSR
jgi:hypothetical protein